MASKILKYIGAGLASAFLYTAPLTYAADSNADSAVDPYRNVSNSKLRQMRIQKEREANNKAQIESLKKQLGGKRSEKKQSISFPEPWTPVKPVYTAPAIPAPVIKSATNAPAKPAYAAPVKSEPLNLDNVLQEEIKANGRYYGLAGLGSVGDVNYILEGGYKTRNWGVGASLESTALELKYGLFNKTKAEIDATFVLILGEKSGAGINFGKDNVFGKNKSYNFRYSAGLGFADGAVVPISVSLTKKLNDRWNIGLEARVNAGDNSSAGGFATLSHGNNTFENNLDGFTGVVKDEDDDKNSGNGTQTQTSTTQTEKDGRINPNPTPAETDGTGRPIAR